MTARPRFDGLSSCTGKAVFLTWELANRCIERRRKSEQTKHEPQRVYRCQHCRHWHIGHPAMPATTRRSTR